MTESFQCIGLIIKYWKYVPIQSVPISLSLLSICLAHSPLGNKSCLIPLINAGSEICLKINRALAMAPRQQLSFPPYLKKPFSQLHPWAAVHTEWAVLSQCFSPDLWESWKTVKKAFCLRSDEGRRGRRRQREEEGEEKYSKRPGVDFQISFVFVSCLDSRGGNRRVPHDTIHGSR